MIELWIVLVLMVGFTGALLVAWPLLRGVRAEERCLDPVLEMYRGQLDEIERDLARGTLAAEQAAAARTEIERRVLALADSPASSRKRLRSGPRLIAGLCMVACVPVLGLLLYLVQGEPDVVLRAGPAVDGRQRVAEIAGALEREPDNPRGWAALGEALSRLGDHEKAGVAFGHAARFDASNAAYPSLAGRALTLAAGGRVTPRALAAFKEALRRDPGEPRASYYVGVAERRAGRPEAALARWRTLVADLSPDAPWAVFVRGRVAALEAEMTDTRGARAAADGAARGKAEEMRDPTRGDVAVAASLSVEDRAAMIRAMVDGLADRLASEPDNVAGWLRLAQSRTALGELDEARAAWARAATLRPDDVDILVAWADGIVAAARPDPPDPAEINPVVKRILALDGRNRRGLDLAGSLALARGDRTVALAHWRTLAEVLDRDDPAQDEIRARIGRLLSE